MKQLHTLADDTLVREFMSGNENAFDELLNRYKDKLYSYILFIIKNNDVADDIFQETFVKAIMTIRQGRYTPQATFYSWLVRIAHNLIIDQFRTEKNVSMVYHDERENGWNDCAFSTNEFRENEMVNEQVQKDVVKLMNHLPKNLREVVVMRFYLNLSFKEIAEKTGVSINTSLGRMRYAILNMRKMAKENHISLALA